MAYVIGRCDYQHCQGACCRILGLPAASRPTFTRAYAVVPLSERPNQEQRAWYRVRGVRVHGQLASVPRRLLADDQFVVRGNGSIKMVVLNAACAQLQEDSGCRLHGTPEKPGICQLYPTVAHDLALVPECGFKIEGEDG